MAPEGPSLPVLASFSEKVTSGLADNEGLISSIKVGKGDISVGGGGSVSTSAAAHGKTTSSGEINP